MDSFSTQFQYLKLHDYVKPETIRLIRAELPHVKIIKAVHVIDD